MVLVSLTKAPPNTNTRHFLHTFALRMCSAHSNLHVACSVHFQRYQKCFHSHLISTTDAITNHPFRNTAGHFVSGRNFLNILPSSNSSALSDIAKYAARPATECPKDVRSETPGRSSTVLRIVKKDIFTFYNLANFIFTAATFASIMSPCSDAIAVSSAMQSKCSPQFRLTR